MVRKKSLHEVQPMNADVSTAARLAKDMIQWESRGNGDWNNAMRRLEAMRGISYSLLWGLCYRQPKDIGLKQWNHLVAVYVAECERHERKFQQRKRTARTLENAATSGLARAAFAGARHLAGKTEKAS